MGSGRVREVVDLESASHGSELAVELQGPGVPGFVKRYDLTRFFDAAGNEVRLEARLPDRGAIQLLQLVLDDAQDPDDLRATAQPCLLFDPHWNGATEPRRFEVQGVYSVHLAVITPVDVLGHRVIVFPHQREEMQEIYSEVGAEADSLLIGLNTWQAAECHGPTDGRGLYYWALDETGASS